MSRRLPKSSSPRSARPSPCMCVFRQHAAHGGDALEGTDDRRGEAEGRKGARAARTSRGGVSGNQFCLPRKSDATKNLAERDCFYGAPVADATKVLVRSLRLECGGRAPAPRRSLYRLTGPS